MEFCRIFGFCRQKESAKPRSSILARFGWVAVAAVLLLGCGGGDDQGACTGATSTPAAPANLPQLNNIQHIVFFIKENRSFDNYFAGFPGADGATSGKISTGSVVPLTEASDSMPYDLGHSWNDALTAIDDGKMDGFNLVEDGDLNGRLLGYTRFSETQIPNYWAYASNFTLADRMFSSLHGPSFPNHLYTVGAQSGGAINNPTGPGSYLEWGCDEDADDRVQVIDSLGNITEQFPCFDFQTTADELESAGVSWAYYAPPKWDPGHIWSALDAIKHIREGLSMVESSRAEAIRNRRFRRLPSCGFVAGAAVRRQRPPSQQRL